MVRLPSSVFLVAIQTKRPPEFAGGLLVKDVYLDVK